MFSPVVGDIIATESFPPDVCLIELSDRLIVESVPFVLVLYERVVMAALWSSRVNDNSFESIGRRLRGRAKVVVQVERVLELKSGVHFDLEECFEVEDDALQIDDENFGRLL